MAKSFNDFIFLDKRLSDLDSHYIAVDFDQDPDPSFAFAKDIEYGDTNRYRSEPGSVRARPGDKLKFELHIIKDPDAYPAQADRIITSADIRDLARWLTSTVSSELLAFEYGSGQEDTPRFFYGQFSDIQSFHVAGDVYGLRLMFDCSSPYGYTDDIVHTAACTGETVSYTITSHDDRLDEYCYPVIRMASAVTGQAYFLNLSDCCIYDQGTIVPAASNARLMEQLQEKVSAYGLAHGYAPEFQLTEDGQHIVTAGNDTAVCFLYRDVYGQEHKCIACYVASTYEYYIVRGGFLCFDLYRELPVTIDGNSLFIFDDIGRMVKLSDLGVTDTDYMYWPRLVNGENTLLFWAEDCTFTITYRETRKAGA
ncbi:phage tail domain-containing protein [[Clostridium] hylemonae]|uniref:phage tail domain-containing protein n=1 Tax=[Clostridium] hylemonae TaxID=89153 RepID=UPI00110689CE|nr:phage tail domain-containing protein [[Clostridium] hylemonae]